ncbi:MAG TPA: hypothetical protein LFW20_00845 [Rickettsia endosymbiont of Omalisus fontisbellaquei]|nr:hypothetical protein [Rickettsia endosymbiont of Omalisus fontisbellaquei]
MPKHGGLLGKVEKEFKKNRNDHDSQVEKCKNQIDRINELNGSKIFTYDRETANVQVPMYGGQTENFQWHWLSGDRGKREKTIEEFKQILNILEARNNPAQYNSLVSNLNASTKNALDVNIKKHNITLSQASETLQSVNDVISLLQKYSIGYDGPMVQIQSVDYTNWKIPLQNISTDDPMFGHAIRAYDAVKTSNQSLFNQNYKELDLNGIVILRNIPFVSHKESSPMSTVKQAAEFIKNSGIVLPLPQEYKGVPTKEVLQEYTNDIGTVIAMHDAEMARINADASASEKINNFANTSTQATTSDEDSDDDIEVISKILGSEVTLTNGAKYEVKKIIDLLDKPNFIKQLTNILSKLSPEDSNLVKKEIALKLAYTSNSDMDKYEAVHEIVDNMPQTFIDEFNNYDTLTLDQMRTEEAKILGDGVSYL